jgi:PAS domain S-box-containing protein
MGSTPDFVSGGGEMGALMRAFDFSKSALGPMTDWPHSLRAATSICINSRYPMFIAWGEHRSMLYNDAYITVLAGKHPWALGRPAHEVWEEIWDILGPHWESVFTDGQATWAEDLLLVMNRSGYDEETYFTFSYSPIRGEGGSVLGMFCACQETTEKVIGERRLKTLRELAAQAIMAKNSREAVDMSMKTCSGNPADIVFAMLYLLDADGCHASLAGTAGFGEKAPPGPFDIALDSKDHHHWPLQNVLQKGAIQVIDNLQERFTPLPDRYWNRPASQAILLPIQFSTHEKPMGVLVCGTSPVRQVDEGYRTFFEVAAGQVASTIANARAYQQERQRAEALAEIDRAKTAFFSNISHEFRTPLTLMLGPIEDLLSRAEAFSPADVEQFATAHRNALRLLKLVNTLLDFSRIEAGRVQAVFEPTDLSSLTIELASVFRAATERAGLSLKVDCAQLPGPVYVDRDMWEKVVLNLISNAFKFTLQGEIGITLQEVDGKAELRVRDTGVGIPDEDMPRIFDRFHRIQNVRSRTHEGSGIGLALVHELVKLHHGSVRAESRINEGSTFIVTVPLGKDHLPPDRIGAGHDLASSASGASSFVEEALQWLPVPSSDEDKDEDGDEHFKHELTFISPTPGEVDENRPWVIVADDNADMRQYLGRMLTGKYSVRAVPDGEAALAAARERRPDLILSDIMMPHLDGLGLVREIRADAALKTIPVILLSARAGEASRIEGLQHGADDYLEKPFSARELQVCVAAHLKIAHERNEAEQSLRESQNMLSEAQRIAGIGSWKCNLLTGEIQWSDQLYEIYGADPKTFVPSIDAFTSYIHPDDRQTLKEKIEQITATGKPVDFEFRIISGAGLTRILRSVGQVTSFDSAGNPLVIVGAHMDITERKHAEQKLQQLNENLERQVAERTELSEARAKQLQQLTVELIEAEENERQRIAGWLHDDLQQLLAGARLQVQSASLKADPAFVLKNVDRLLEEAINSSRRLSHELSPPVLHQFGLLASLKWLVQQVDELFGLKVDLAADDIKDIDDKSLKVLLFRAVQELLFNVVKHSGMKTASVRLSGAVHKISLTVMDQGRGFKPEALNTGKAKGGLGLASLKERVNALGGDFVINSAPGKGSRFALSFPVKPKQMMLFKQTADPQHRDVCLDPLSDSQNLRVLLADDHKVMRQGLVGLISGKPGIEVVGEASDGKEALELSRKLRPHLVLMDISMPRMDGIEATRLIKAEMPEVCVIGLSMFDDAEAEQKIRKAGAEDYVNKSESSAELLKTIYQFAGKGKTMEN